VCALPSEKLLEIAQNEDVLFSHRCTAIKVLTRRRFVKATDTFLLLALNDLDNRVCITACDALAQFNMPKEFYLSAPDLISK